jgi:hypothetical protein
MNNESAAERSDVAAHAWHLPAWEIRRRFAQRAADARRSLQHVHEYRLRPVFGAGIDELLRRCGLEPPMFDDEHVARHIRDNALGGIANNKAFCTAARRGAHDEKRGFFAAYETREGLLRFAESY